MPVPTSEQLNRMMVEISAGWKYGDPRSQLPKSPMMEGRWKIISRQMKEIADEGGIVEIPGEWPDLTGFVGSPDVGPRDAGAA